MKLTLRLAAVLCPLSMALLLAAALLPQPEAWAARRIIQACLAGAGFGAVLSVGLAVYFLSRLQKLSETARRVAQGDLEYRVPEEGRDEFDELSGYFNRMMKPLEDLEGLQDRFMEKITHDLRNPVTAVLTQADVLVEGYKGPLNPKQKEAALSISRSARTLAESIDNILDVTRLETGRIPLNPSELELDTEISAVLGRMRPRAEGWGVSLEHSVAEGAELANADAEAFRRILANLVSNALKFTPSGGGVSVKAEAGKDGGVVVCVRDNGVGIPQDRMPRLFEKFYQVPETRHKVRHSPGSGLGLFICKKLVEAHGGRIWVESELFRGASFRFTLPARAKAGTDTPSQAQPGS
ncbi:MAG: HAMP domain-containing sensor histidine kinase [Elusimicrobiota bacterium]